VGVNLAYVLLGFMCLRALTQYDILKALKMRVSPFYQPSLGSIQATLKKLLNVGWVTVEVSQGGRKKNIYRITDAGKKAFEGWMLADAYDESVSKLDAELSTRLFFLGLMRRDERKKIVKTAVDFIEKLLTEYGKADEVYSKTVCPPSFADVARFQLKTLSMGIHQLASMRNWLRGIYSELEDEI
jgi:DNA-binding PadR family transcriptional regulator